MAKYYVNDRPQPTLTAEHEVHEEGCFWLSLIHKKTALGEHENCQSAIKAASKLYSTVDGCKTCIEACHSK